MERQKAPLTQMETITAPRPAALKLGDQKMQATTICEYPGYNEKFKSFLSSELGEDIVTPLSDIEKQADSAEYESSVVPSNPILRWLREVAWSPYEILFTLVLLANTAGMIVVCSFGFRHGSPLTKKNAATAVSSNLLMTVLIRNQVVLNLMYHVVISLSRSTPLFIRRHFANLYHFGGLHSACGVAAFAWYVLFAVLVFREAVTDGAHNLLAISTTAMILMLLLIIIACSIPPMRAKLHDYFEFTHRFGGWTVLLLFWIQTIAAAIAQHERSTGEELLQTPTFWSLIIITLSIIWPWSRTRKRKVQAEPLSNHAVRLYFDGKVEPCMTVQIAKNPLKEMHPFAVIPEVNKERKGYSVIVSTAGDWTEKFVTNPPKTIWVRNAPVIGMLRVATMFRSVLVVATGSGIGPCLGLFTSKHSPVYRVLWTARKPMETYGKNIVDAVLAADVNAVILDTHGAKKPDMVSLVHEVYKKSGVEAIAVISNQKTTELIVQSMIARGIPAYGPIWDS